MSCGHFYSIETTFSSNPFSTFFTSQYTINTYIHVDEEYTCISSTTD